MWEYEIRIFRKGADHLCLSMNKCYFNDYTAIRAALSMSLEGEVCQVFRGDHCLLDNGGDTHDQGQANSET
jgi:hypothetical protein